MENDNKKINSEEVQNSIDKLYTTNLTDEKIQKLLNSRKEGANKILTKFNIAFFTREQPNIIMNAMNYSTAYIYNLERSTNYTPNFGNDDDNNLSTGHVHEVIFTLMAILLSLEFNGIIKARDEKANSSRDLAKIYKSLVQYSFDLEKFNSLLPFILNETFTQGDCFVMETWDVQTKYEKIPYIDKGEGKKTYITKNNEKKIYDKIMSDNSFIENLKYDEKEIIIKRAKTVKLDGRDVIEGNPEIERTQDQPFLVVQYVYTVQEAENLFKNLSLWPVAKQAAGSSNFTYLYGKQTIYNYQRTHANKELCYVHYYFNKQEDRYNVFINGIMMYDYETPMSLFYPAMNYPIVKFGSEIQGGSYRSKSVPMKLKNVTDYQDFFINVVAFQIEAAIVPAINANSRRTINRDMFRTGSINHQIRYGEDYEFTDPDVFKRGLQPGALEWINKIQELIQNQSINSITLGQATDDQLATGIIASQQNQLTRLKPIVHSFLRGMCELWERRLETIKYKMCNDSEGAKDGVHQEIEYTKNDYSLNIKIANLKEFGDIKDVEDTLFQQSFNEKKKGRNIDYALLDKEQIKFHNITVEGEFVENIPREAKIQKIFQQLSQLSNLMPNFDRTELEQQFLDNSDYSDGFFKKLYEAPVNPTLDPTKSNANPDGNTASGVAKSVNSKKSI